MRSNTLALLRNLCRRSGRPHTNKQMHMIRVDCQFEDLPSLVLAFSLNKCAAFLSHLTREHRLSPLWTPNQVIHDQVNPMFVSSIFHVSILYTISTIVSTCLWLKPGRKPALSAAVKIGRLAAG